MIKQLIIGLACEGKTDERFLLSIIKRTFENVVFQYTTNIEILDVQTIKVPNKAFIEYAYDSALEGTKSFGILIFCLHTDSDSNSDSDAFKSKINPAIENINSKEGDICKTVVPIVPIRMIESWMLADSECFKSEIGTNKSYRDLGITQNPERITDPKGKITEAIRIAFEDKPSRRSKPDISELYLPIGQKCNLTKLENLHSYLKFKEAVKSSLERINYIRRT